MRVNTVVLLDDDLQFCVACKAQLEASFHLRVFHCSDNQKAAEFPFDVGAEPELILLDWRWCDPPDSGNPVFPDGLKIYQTIRDRLESKQEFVARLVILTGMLGELDTFAQTETHLSKDLFTPVFRPMDIANYARTLDLDLVPI